MKLKLALDNAVELSALKKAEEKFRRLLEFAPDATVIVDREGKIVLVNSQAEKTFGYRPGELTGQLVEVLIPPRLQSNHARYRDSYMSDPRVRPMSAGVEFFALRKNGEEIRVEISLSPFHTEEGLWVISAIRDITERKKLQLALQKAKDELEIRVEERTAELSRSNQELDQFAYVASHDLQQPLRMVASYVQLLQRRLADKLGPDEREFIHYAVDGTSRMKRLIDDLLTFSRVGTHGKLLAPTSSEQVFCQTLKHLEVAIQECGAEISHEELPIVLADETQLGQLFQNLLENALKYRSTRSPKIHVWAERAGPRWVFSVRDNGIGIDSQYFDRIFVMFQRLHGKNEYSGTGLGLAVCKKVVERHGGRIWVESKVGEGSIFRFTIPGQEHPNGLDSCKTDRNLVGGGRAR